LTAAGQGRKKVLIISYNYPPVANMAAKRSFGFSKYLSEFDWDPIVLTVKNPDRNLCPIDPLIKIPKGVKVEKSFAFNISKIASLISGVLNQLGKIFLKKELPKGFPSQYLTWIDFQSGWLPFCFLKAVYLIRKHKIDLIYISCKPASTSVVGLWLKKKFPAKKVIIDFRDAWTVDPYKKYGKCYTKMINGIEKKVFGKINCLIVATEGLKRLYQDKYRNLKIYNIYNGFDPDILNCFTKGLNKDRFIILHTGNFYLNRSPRNLLKALAGIKDRSIEFWHVGLRDKNLEKLFDDYSESVTVKLLGRKTYQETMNLVNEASLLYLNQATPIAEGLLSIAIAGKTYEYLASGIPILAEMTQGDNLDILRTYASVYYLNIDHDPVKMRQTILAAYRQWKRGELKRETSPEYMEKFSRKNLTKELADLFNQISR